MASIPTASVDALVHVNAYGGRKTARLFNIRSGRMQQAESGRRFLQSFEAWQIAAIAKPFQCFAHCTMFPHMAFEQEKRT
jgi:hypothetical protein